MSDAERESPRTAIRNWLQVTHKSSAAKPVDALLEQRNNVQGLSHRSGRHYTTRYPLETKDWHNEDAGRNYQKHSKSGIWQKRVTDKAFHVNSVKAQPQQQSQETTAVNPDGLGLAERLGLHAPFRTFKAHSDDDIPEIQSRPRKRRRSRSSTSSYLEPAAANDFLDSDHDRPSHATILRTANTRTELGDIAKNYSPTASQDLDMVLPSPEKLLKTYERRPRHKTRLDRYELKESTVFREKTKQPAKKDRKKKKQKKHKRTEKSGAALMHDFAAKNVANDRLTLKPAKTLGLFGKGKASSPIRRKGLPDLTFSEMTFLNSRREKPKDSFEDSSNRPLNKKKRQKSTKAADTEAEFSRYFMSAKPTSHDTTTPYPQRYHEDSRRSRDHGSPQALVDLPERPFLGFGSCGPNTSISPAKIPLNADSRSLRRGVSHSPTRSTSYLTWSQIRGPSNASPPTGRRHHVEPLKSSKLSNRKRTFPASHKDQHSIPPVSPLGLQTATPGAQGVAPRSSSEHQTVNETQARATEPRLVTDQQLRSSEKSQRRSATRTTEPDAAKIPQDIEGSIPANTHPTEVATHEDSHSALMPQDQSAYHSSVDRHRCEPQAQDMRHSSTQTSVKSPHEDQLDDILERLLKDCKTNIHGSYPASRATSSHHNCHVSEKARVPETVGKRSNGPARAFVDSAYALEAPEPASNSFKGPRCARVRLNSAIDGSGSQCARSRGSLDSSSRASLGSTRGCAVIPSQSQVDSRNAWNGYDGFYERQQEQADLIPKTSREDIPTYTVVQNHLSGPLQANDRGAGISGYAPGLHSVDVGDDFDDYRPYLYDSLQERNENDNYQEPMHGEWDKRFLNPETSNDSGASVFKVSHKAGEGFDNEFVCKDYPGRKQSFSQADQQQTERQLFTTNLSDIDSSWRPRQPYSSNHDLEAYAADIQVQDVDRDLSGFWTPHKLY